MEIENETLTSSVVGEMSSLQAEWTWQPLLPHQLFNKINNLVSTKILDLRPAAEFETLHIHKSHGISTASEEETAASVRVALASRHERTTYIELVILINETTANAELLSKIASLVIADGGSIVKGSLSGSSADASPRTSATPESAAYRCVLYVLTEATTFFSRYQNCKFFLEGTSLPARQWITTNVYANEIIADFLYLGDCANAADLSQHQALGITHIVDASNTRVSKNVSLQNGIEYLEIKIMDSASAQIAEHFDTVHAFISKARAANGKILIHCMAGISRSSSLVISYLVKHEGMTLRDAVTMVVTERPVVCPNEGFQQQLLNCEASVRNGENTIADQSQFSALVQEVSKIWSQSNISENAFDKVPIEMWRQVQHEKMKYLEASDPSAQENALPPNIAVDDRNGGSLEMLASKPPKQFLKRGEGKRAVSRSGTRRPARDTSAAPVEKPSLSAYVGKLRNTVASSASEEILVLVPGSSACNSVDTSMVADEDSSAAAVVAAAVAENPTVVVEEGVAALAAVTTETSEAPLVAASVEVAAN